MPSDRDFLFQGRWGGHLLWYVVRPGADVGAVRRVWEARAATTERPRRDRRVRRFVLLAAFLLPFGGAALVLAGLGAVIASSGGDTRYLTGPAFALLFLACSGGLAAVDALVDRVLPSPTVPRDLGVSQDLEIVQDELAEWRRTREDVGQEEMWSLATGMARLCDVADGSLPPRARISQPYLRVAIDELWQREQTALSGRAQSLGLPLPPSFAEEDPEALFIELADSRFAAERPRVPAHRSSPPEGRFDE